MRVRRLQVGILPKTLLARSHEKRSMHVSPALVESAALDVAGVYDHLETRPEGLTADEAATRLAEHGQNILAKDQRPGILTLVWRAVRNPLVILLAVLAAVSFATGDPRAATMMLLMIVLSVGLRLIQEAKASGAAAKLKAMISVKATVLRNGAARETRAVVVVAGAVWRCSTTCPTARWTAPRPTPRTGGSGAPSPREGRRRRARRRAGGPSRAWPGGVTRTLQKAVSRTPRGARRAGPGPR